MQDSEERRPRSTAPDPGVTVVVPAYNAGPYLVRCLQSLLGQTLDRARFDVIAIDDGSTDGTGEILDRAARDHPDLLRVEHIPNSGWPGRPRNLGTDLSERQYVFYCDADDWLLPTALEAMLTQAIAHDADVLLARPVGNRRRVGLAVYERGDYCTTARETPGVFTTLTCQKLFRRGFLRDRDVRFGEGRVRLEDFMFMTAAYLRAERISVLGTQPCYVFERRDDGGNLTATPASEDEYFTSVEKIVDLVLAETEAGPEQDLLLDRVLRSELIGPLSRPALLRKPPDVQAEALERGRRLLTTKIPPSAVAHQDPLVRSRARAIERGDLAAIQQTIRAEAGVSGSRTATGLIWQGNAIRVDMRLALEYDGTVVALRRAGAQLHLPEAVAGTDPADVTQPLARSAAFVHLRSRDRSEEWRVPVTLAAVPTDDDAPRLEWSAHAVIDVFTLAAGAALRPGVWDVHVVLTGCGFSRAGALQGAGRVEAGVNGGVDPLRPLTAQGLRVRPYWTQAGSLAVTVRVPQAPVGGPAGVVHAGLRRIARRLRPAGVRRVGVRRAGTWRRRVLALVGRLGLTVTDVGPGVALLSRSAELDVVPLRAGRAWMVVKGRASGSVPVPQQLDDHRWVVASAGAPAAPLAIDRVGSRGWLVSHPDAGPFAPVALENQTLQHLAARHVTWLLDRYDVDVVLDVGANTGQYGQGLRRSGYAGRIDSFEPVPHFADAVDTLSRGDALWNVHRIALGRTQGTVPIRVQRTFSSLLPASEYGKGRFATLRDFADKEDQVVDVPLRRLDSVLDELLTTVTRADGGPPRVFLKMDTQGFDLETFHGLGDRAGDIVGLQSEVALLLIYDGMPRMPEALATYEAAGFELSGMYPVTSEPDGRVIEYDCVMVRASAAP